MNTTDLPRRRRAWPWMLLALFSLALLAAAALAWAAHGLTTGYTLDIDGESWQLPALGALPVGALLAVAAVVALVVFVVVPLALLAGLFSAALGIGLALVSVLGVAALVCSPLILFGLLAWWALRPGRPALQSPR